MNSAESSKHRSTNDRHLPTPDELEQIKNCLKDLRFGSLNIIVQDGVIVQLDRTEKKRLRMNKTQPE